MKDELTETKKAYAEAVTKAMWVKGLITTEEKAKIDAKNAQKLDDAQAHKKP